MGQDRLATTKIKYGQCVADENAHLYRMSQVYRDSVGIRQVGDGRVFHDVRFPVGGRELHIMTLYADPLSSPTITGRLTRALLPTIVKM